MTTIDLATAEPIDGKFVWQQRDEGNSGKVTFSIMMPDVGNYVVAIGGRSNKRMCGSTLPDGAYFPTVLMYQVLVNFVSVNDPMFPRQHLSPTIVKLLEPLRHKVLGGPQRFAVAPCVPNILAVGVVNRIFKTGAGNAGGPSSRVDIPAAPSTPTPRAGSSSVNKKPAAGGKDKQVEAAAPVAAPPKPLAPEIERVQIELLPLNPKLCVFEGTVDLHIGLVELWVFFGDPASLCVGGAPSVTAHSDATASLQQVGDSSLNGSPAASPVPSAAAPPSPSPPKGVPTVLKPKGQFYPFVTEIQVVKRVPAKELALNEGRSLIQPLPAMERDRGAVLQLLTSVGVGEASHPRPVDDDGNARTIGTYFAGRQQQHQQSNTTKK
ncbi:Hypothetical protein, putative [Bodo saltans]|nr:Hypothetical protein, putative [Bodo saltans]|eukprot:CUI14561.1 Hypothetical protein, putative [Bodo saltans]